MLAILFVPHPSQAYSPPSLLCAREAEPSGLLLGSAHGAASSALGGGGGTQPQVSGVASSLQDSAPAGQPLLQDCSLHWTHPALFSSLTPDLGW